MRWILFLMALIQILLQLFGNSIPSPPSITSQPQNIEVIYNGTNTASFTVVATGTAPLSYNWLVYVEGDGWIDLGLHGATYTTAPVVPKMDGYIYKCLVSNSAGAVESNEAVLTVLEVPIP